MKLILLVFLILTFIGPLWIYFRGDIDFSLHYQTADRESTHLAPDAATTSDAVIQAYSARAFNWRGLISVHTWIATKAKNANHYTVYQVIGWRLSSGLPALFMQSDIPDRSWYGQKPKIILDIRGEQAEILIPKITEASKKYPYPDKYETWPGPNSNTFTAFVGREVPELKLAIPPNAVGKDFLPNSTFFTRAPSGTGYQLSIYGLLGILIARQEGFEINLLGLVFGVNPRMLAIELPGLGELSFVKK
jgi:hypothetical protein